MNENFYQLAAGAMLLSGVSISIFFRGRADRQSGGRVSSASEARPIFLALRLGGVVLWGSVISYLINPAWMAWSQVDLLDWLRSLGVASGVICVGLVYWLFSSLGAGITPTVTTRANHRLVTTGPYRWVRHPLYTVGTGMFLSFALMAASWAVGALAVLAFILLAMRTPSEEAHLIQKFGDEYRAYMARTARFLPGLF